MHAIFYDYCNSVKLRSQSASQLHFNNIFTKSFAILNPCFCYRHLILSGWLLKPWFVIWNPHIRSNFTQSESSRCSVSSTLYPLFNKMYGLAQLVIFLISSSLTCAGVSVSFIGCPSNLNLICLIDSPWKSIKTCYSCDKFSLVNPLLAQSLLDKRSMTVMGKVEKIWRHITLIQHTYVMQIAEEFNHITVQIKDRINGVL